LTQTRLLEKHFQIYEQAVGKFTLMLKLLAQILGMAQGCFYTNLACMKADMSKFCLFRFSTGMEK
jgi:hypothetical protein